MVTYISKYVTIKVHNGVERNMICVVYNTDFTYIFSTASDISAQNSCTILFNFLKANAFSSGSLSSRRARIPAEIKFMW